MGIMSEIDLEGREGYMTAALDISNSRPPSSAPAQSGNSEPIVRLGIDPHRYTSKPDDYDVKAIKMRMLKSTVTVPLSAVVKAIEQGQTICPAVIDGTHGSHAAEFWVSQQIFCVDIDNAAKDKSRLPDGKYISIEQAWKILEDNGIKPFFIYRSFNYKKAEWGKPQEFSKYRICVRIDSVITDNTEREHIIKAFIALFGEAVDTGCKNADRIFFGSKPDCSVFEDINAITPKSMFLTLYNKLFPSVNTPAVPKHSLPAFALQAASSGDWSKEFDFDIDKLLYCLDPDSHYNTWISITAAYKGAGGDMETWVLWSKQSTKWKESDRKHWSVNGTSRGALINLAKQTPDGRKYMDDMKQAQAEAKKQYKATKSNGEWGKRVLSDKPSDDKGEEIVNFNGKVLTKAEARDYIKNHPFLEGTERNCKISPVMLCEFFLKDRHLIIVSSERSSDMRIFKYMNGVYRLIDERKLKGGIDDVIKENGVGNLRTTGIINEVYKLITYDNMIMVDEEQLNADENIINFQNGILHLDTMELTAHSPSVLSTIQIPCKWLGEQSTPLFDSFISTFTSDNVDKQTLFLEFMGGAISNVDGTRNFKKALFVVGKSNSGKSVLRNLTTELIGEQNQSGVSLAKLEERFGAWELYQRRLVGSPDLGYPSIKQAEIFKNVTGGDYIPIEQKNQPVFQYRYQGFMWFGCNRLPKFPPDTATYNRMIIVECSNVIPEEKQDRMLIPKLLTEASGIVYKAVMAIKAAIKRGHFTIPAESAELMKSYRVDNSIYMQFYDECCVKRPVSVKGQPIFNDNVTTATIMNVAKQWLINNYPSSKFAKSTFKRELEAEGIDIAEYRTSKARFFSFTLTAEAKVEFDIPIEDNDSWGEVPPPPIPYDDYSSDNPLLDLEELPF